jgi:hypothetical protein
LTQQWKNKKMYGVYPVTETASTGSADPTTTTSPQPPTPPPPNNNLYRDMVIPRCQHIKFDGVQCGSPAVHNRRHCFYHNRVRYERRSRVVVPLLENAKAINYAAMQTAELLAGGAIDRRDAAQILFALKIASLNLRYLQQDPPAGEMALEDPSDAYYKAGMDKAYAEMRATGKDITEVTRHLIDERIAGLTP